MSTTDERKELIREIAQAELKHSYEVDAWQRGERDTPGFREDWTADALIAAGYRKPVAAPSDTDDDERILAWMEVADHEAFTACYEQMNDHAGLIRRLRYERPEPGDVWANAGLTETMEAAAVAIETLQAVIAGVARVVAPMWRDSTVYDRNALIDDIRRVLSQSPTDALQAHDRQVAAKALTDAAAVAERSANAIQQGVPYGDGWHDASTGIQHEIQGLRAIVSEPSTPERCKRCNGTETVNLGTRSDAEYHPCPDCKNPAPSTPEQPEGENR